MALYTKTINNTVYCLHYAATLLNTLCALWYIFMRLYELSALFMGHSPRLMELCGTLPSASGRHLEEYEAEGANKAVIYGHDSLSMELFNT